MSRKKEFIRELVREEVLRALKEMAQTPEGQEFLKKSESGNACELVLCEDEDGNIVARPKGKCPDGYVEKMKLKIKDKGIIF